MQHCADSSLTSYLSLWPSMLLFLSLEATTLPLLHVIILLPEVGLNFWTSSFFFAVTAVH